MRLLSTAGELRLNNFETYLTPPYAILSHTWCDQEVSYQELLAVIAGAARPPGHRGWDKIFGARRKAAAKYGWIWIDTCCIDKTSSAELSEAINSMFTWYGSANRCYAYFEDVTGTPRVSEIDSEETLWKSCAASRWFTRGWTLQELIVPSEVELCMSNWQTFGTRTSRSDRLARITGIDQHVLEDPTDLHELSIAQRMSWAAHRETTRLEDIAYCLMGIFNINMPLLYGEGMKAFVRLQEEILKDTKDQTIFAWNSPSEALTDWGGILAEHPRAFKHSSRTTALVSAREPHSVTNRGIRIQAHILEDSTRNLPPRLLLSCQIRVQGTSSDIGKPKVAMVPIAQVPGREDRYIRDSSRPLLDGMDAHDIPPTSQLRTIYIQKTGSFRKPNLLKRSVCLRWHFRNKHMIEISDATHLHAKELKPENPASSEQQVFTTHFRPRFYTLFSFSTNHWLQ
jgi:hypothetical protein